MFFKKYNIVIFKGDCGASQRITLRGWMFVFLLLFFLGSTAANVFLVDSFTTHKGLAGNLEESRKTVQEQKMQILTLAAKIKGVEDDLLRIRDFNSKLRVMVNLEHQKKTGQSSIGGSNSNEFSDAYLPVHRQELLARRMHNFLHQLNIEARLEEVKQQELLRTIREKSDILAATPSIRPSQGWYSSSFGWRTSPFTGKREFHKGLDISAPRGTPVLAPAKGRVVYVGKKGGYGLTVTIDHGGGLTTKYAHLHGTSVKKGDRIGRGDVIAQVGNTGRSTGPHLHYEVRVNGVPVNPRRYILDD
jgi:murein DD-endopeptidase MepM/ murein hydrolase activator NlpD